MIGGALRPSDPRRFLIESMVGAMTADGRIDEGELVVLRQRLTEHDLFAGLPADAADVLVEVATDAIRFAGGGARRVGAIARGLPSRTHRLAAYAMACEVCAADTVGAEEQRYLEALRAGLGVGEREAAKLLEAAASGQAMTALATRVDVIRAELPYVLECLALQMRALPDPPADPAAWLRGVAAGLRDVSERPEAIESAIEQALRRDDDPPAGLARIAAEVTDPDDRHWMAVYLMLVERGRGGVDWHGAPLLAELAAAFGLNDTEMDRAWWEAASLPAVSPPPAS